MTDEDGRDYADVLAEAQGSGYAEADPTGDVEGHDAVNKLVILARLAFGRWLDPAAIATPARRRRRAGRPGHHRGQPADQADGPRGGPDHPAARDGRDRRRRRRIEAAVLPTAVPLDSPLGRTAGVRNRVEVDAEPVGTVGFDGPGAGGAGDRRRGPGRPRRRSPAAAGLDLGSAAPPARGADRRRRVRAPVDGDVLDDARAASGTRSRTEPTHGRARRRADARPRLIERYRRVPAGRPTRRRR